MNWTTFDPIEGQKYIVETSNGSIFLAHVINGNSWWSDKGFPVECVVRWIPYPDGGGNANDDIPIEVLFKYLHRDFKNMKRIAKEESEKVAQLKKLNKELVSDYGRLTEEIKVQKEESDNEMKRLYDLIHEISAERDALKKELGERLKEQPNADVPSKELIRENKQMKAFLRSIMNTCDMVRDLEIA